MSFLVEIQEITEKLWNAFDTIENDREKISNIYKDWVTTKNTIKTWFDQFVHVFYSNIEDFPVLGLNSKKYQIYEIYQQYFSIAKFDFENNLENLCNVTTITNVYNGF